MGCCFSKKTQKKTPLNLNESSSKLDIQNTDLKLKEQQLKMKNINERKRNDFIDNFLSKNSGLNYIEKYETIFITNLNKKMFITKDLITVEEDFILKVNLNANNSCYDNYWMFLDSDVKNMVSREIYIDDIKVDDSQFEVKEYNIKLKFEKTYNNQTRKVKIIEKIRNQFDNYNATELILNKQGIAAKYIIYLDYDLNLDDISNKNYKINKELNLAYYEGIINNETENSHGFINYSKKINYQIYKYIPELSQDTVQNIIRTKEASGESGLNFIANYKKVVMTDYGSDIDEIILMKVLNYKNGQHATYFSIGAKDIKSEIYLAEINGKIYPYQNDGGVITFNNLNCYNNQYIEIHLKYKYITNEEKDIYRKENVSLSLFQNSYVKCIVQIPDKYFVVTTKDIFTRSPEIKNMYIYQGILKEENINETFEFCYEKARWDIDYEYIIEGNNNINNCEFTMNKIFKGGNLKELKYDINKNGATLVDSGNKYIFKYDNINTNKTNLNFKIKVENSTSNYIFTENSADYITKIPPQEVQFWKNLANQIISSDKTNYSNHKKIGKWVYNYITYNLSLTGKKFTAMEIYKNKQGVCEHFTLLYNTLLNAYGIEAIKVSGYAKDITEYNTKVKPKKEKENKTGQATERHAWTLAKIDGEWVPLDATWNLFDKNVPITHVFQNYGDGTQSIKYNIGNEAKFKCTKENITYVKS